MQMSFHVKSSMCKHSATHLQMARSRMPATGSEVDLPGCIRIHSELLVPAVISSRWPRTGALELALACDFIVADDSARFADTHGKWGLVSAWGMLQRLPRRIGLPAAKRMMMTARVVDAAEAYELGLIDLLAPVGQLDEVLKGFTTELLANSRFTNVAIKRMQIETDGMSVAESLAHEHYRYPGLAPDHQARIAAFRRG